LVGVIPAEISLTTIYIGKIPSGVYNLFPKLDDSSIDFILTTIDQTYLSGKINLVIVLWWC